MIDFGGEIAVQYQKRKLSTLPFQLSNDGWCKLVKRGRQGRKYIQVYLGISSLERSRICHPYSLQHIKQYLQ